VNLDKRLKKEPDMNNFIPIYWVFNMVWLGILTASVYLFGWWAIPIFLVASTTVSCIIAGILLRHA